MPFLWTYWCLMLTLCFFLLFFPWLFPGNRSSNIADWGIDFYSRQCPIGRGHFDLCDCRGIVALFSTSSKSDCSVCCSSEFFNDYVQVRGGGCVENGTHTCHNIKRRRTGFVADWDGCVVRGRVCFLLRRGCRCSSNLIAARHIRQATCCVWSIHKNQACFEGGATSSIQTIIEKSSGKRTFLCLPTTNFRQTCDHKISVHPRRESN